MVASPRTRRQRGRGRSNSPSRSGSMRIPGRVWTYVALGIVFAISVARSLHLGFPLERDEGEFGYIAQQLLHGVPVYVSAHTQKLPGTYVAYAFALAFFG